MKMINTRVVGKESVMSKWIKIHTWLSIDIYIKATCIKWRINIGIDCVAYFRAIM